MNFKDYLEILASESLEESPLADGVLTKAMEAKNEEEKLTYIFLAIDLARMYGSDAKMREFIQQEFIKVEGYQHKGFLHEYKKMKG